MTDTVVSMLSVKQRRILAEIRAFQREHGYAPTLRELGARVGLASPSSVLWQLQQLEAKGWICRSAGSPRALVVLDPTTGQP